MDQAEFFTAAYRIINKYNAASKRPRTYGPEGMVLYSAETHMLEVIGDRERITTTQLAEAMAITKGAVSQTTAKLLEKGLIQKETKPTGFFLSLTERGQEVFAEHRQFHSEMTERIGTVLAGMTQESREGLRQILAVLDELLDQYQE